MSGISADDKALEAYAQLSRSEILYAIFKIAKVDGTEKIVLEKTGEKMGSAEEQDAKWEEFCKELPETECRYGVFDLRSLTMNDGRMGEGVCFIAWSPEDSKVRHKMTYGGTMEAFKGTLEGIKKCIVGHDLDELYEEGRSVILQK
jgi:hypothetical protein